MVAFQRMALYAALLPVLPLPSRPQRILRDCPVCGGRTRFVLWNLFRLFSFRGKEIQSCDSLGQHGCTSSPNCRETAKAGGLIKMRASDCVNGQMLRITQKGLANFCCNSCIWAERMEAYFYLDFFAPFLSRKKGNYYLNSASKKTLNNL